MVVWLYTVCSHMFLFLSLIFLLFSVTFKLVLSQWDSIVCLVSVLGGVCPGDQLLNVEGTSLLGVNAHQAHEELSKAMNRNSVSLC